MIKIGWADQPAAAQRSAAPVVTVPRYGLDSCPLEPRSSSNSKYSAATVISITCPAQPATRSSVEQAEYWNYRNNKVSLQRIE